MLTPSLSLLLLPITNGVLVDKLTRLPGRIELLSCGRVVLPVDQVVGLSLVKDRLEQILTLLRVVLRRRSLLVSGYMAQGWSTRCSFIEGCLAGRTERKRLTSLFLTRSGLFRFRCGALLALHTRH